MSDRPPHGETDRWIFAAGVLVATLLGMALRAWHLTIPLRYDEAVTFMEYASGTFLHAATAYPTPNNHVLNTVLIHGLTSWLGPDPFVIRVPAFLAGTLLVPAAAWMAVRRHGARVAVVAAFLVAATPVLVEYSTNARGYTLVALATVAGIAVGEELLERSTSRGWFAFVAIGVAGLWAVPVMLLPWAGISLWMAASLLLGEGTPRRRLRRLLPLLAAEAAVAVTVAALYAPLVRANGLDALIANRFVEPLAWGPFLGSVADAGIGVLQHWTRAVPWPLVALLGLGAVAAPFAGGPGPDGRRSGRTGRVPLALALMAGAIVVMLVRRNPGEARVWLWALAPLMVGVAADLTGLLHRALRPSLAPRVATGVAAAWCALSAVHLVVDRPLWRSLETGGFMEVEAVAAWLSERVEPGDAVVTDFESWEPLRFYLARLGVDPRRLDDPPAPDGRAWIVLNRTEDDRPPRTRRRAAALGIELGGANAMATYGRVEIYGFGSGGER